MAGWSDAKSGDWRSAKRMRHAAVTPEDREAREREQAVQEAWEAGDLSWKMRPHQETLYADIRRIIDDEDLLTGVLNCVRRFGKSFVTSTVATEECQRTPETLVRLGAPNGKSMKKNILPSMRKLLADCPERLRPRWKSNDGMYSFPNGSELHILGLNDGHVDDARGTATNLALIDEAGFVDDLKYAVNDVMMPQTAETGGTVFLASTPPSSAGHDFVDFIAEAKAEGAYIHRTIYDDTSKNDAYIQRIISKCGGVDSVTFRREYMAEIVTDANLAIIPEWRPQYVREVPRPQAWELLHRYEALDIGVRDFTAGLFAYYDFMTAKLIVEDEFSMNGHELTTDGIAAEIRGREKALDYENPSTGARVYLRVADNNNLLLVNDLSAKHGLPFLPTTKDELPAMVNKLRVWVNSGRVLVHPRCKNLIACLEHGVWRNTKAIGRDFGRTSKLGHFDALAALIYLVRNVNETANPVPRSYGMDRFNKYIPAHFDRAAAGTADTLKRVFGWR